MTQLKSCIIIKKFQHKCTHFLNTLVNNSTIYINNYAMGQRRSMNMVNVFPKTQMSQDQMKNHKSEYMHEEIYKLTILKYFLDLLYVFNQLTRPQDLL